MYECMNEQLPHTNNFRWNLWRVCGARKPDSYAAELSNAINTTRMPGFSRCIRTVYPTIFLYRHHHVAFTLTLYVNLLHLHFFR
jgi:hypothetical protein